MVAAAKILASSAIERELGNLFMRVRVVAALVHLMVTLIQTAKLNDIDPQAWLADVLARINDHKSHDLAALLP
jgi:hypothetical protein